MNSSTPVPSVLRETPFALFWCARVASSIAFQMQAVAVGWQAYTLTGSAFYLGLVGLAQFLPMFLLTLAVGHVADRYERRLIARVCQTVEAVAGGALAVGSATGWLGRDNLLAIVAVAGAARAFEGPIMQALVPGLVPGPLLPRAYALAASANQTATILGPTLGGFLYAAGPSAVYGTAGGLFRLAHSAWRLSACAGCRHRGSRSVSGPSSPGLPSSAVVRHFLGAISLDLFAVLLGGATALLPITPATFCVPDPGGWGFCAPPPRSVPSPCRCCSRGIR